MLDQNNKPLDPKVATKLTHELNNTAALASWANTRGHWIAVLLRLSRDMAKITDYIADPIYWKESDS